MNVYIPDQRRVIEFYGMDAQAVIHMEECAELIQAISKMRRLSNAGADDTDARCNLLEELADVLICMKQIQSMYGIDDRELQSVIDKKCTRQEAQMHEFV